MSSFLANLSYRAKRGICIINDHNCYSDPTCHSERSEESASSAITIVIPIRPVIPSEARNLHHQRSQLSFRSNLSFRAKRGICIISDHNFHSERSEESALKAIASQTSQ